MIRAIGASRPGVWLIGHLISPLHRALYVRSRGRAAGATRVLLLTVTGRRTGRAHTVPLFYVREGTSLAVCNTEPGSERPSPWALNVRATPEVTVRVGADVGRYRAREATDREAAELWPRFVRIWPSYEAMYRRTGRRAIFVLEPLSS